MRTMRNSRMMRRQSELPSPSRVYLYQMVESDATIWEYDMDAGTYYSGGGANLLQGTFAVNGTTGLTDATRTALGTVTGATIQYGLNFNSDHSKFCCLTGSQQTATIRNLTVPGDVSGGNTAGSTLALGATCYRLQLLDGGTTLIAVLAGTYRRYTLSTPWDLSTATLTATITHGLNVAITTEELIGFEDGGTVVWMQDIIHSETNGAVYVRKCSTPYDYTTAGVFYPVASAPQGAICAVTPTGMAICEATDSPGFIYRHNL